MKFFTLFFLLLISFSLKVFCMEKDEPAKKKLALKEFSKHKCPDKKCNFSNILQIDNLASHEFRVSELYKLPNCAGCKEKIRINSFVVLPQGLKGDIYHFYCDAKIFSRSKMKKVCEDNSLFPFTIFYSRDSAVDFKKSFDDKTLFLNFPRPDCLVDFVIKAVNLYAMCFAEKASSERSTIFVQSIMNLLELFLKKFKHFSHEGQTEEGYVRRIIKSIILDSIRCKYNEKQVKFANLVYNEILYFIMKSFKDEDIIYLLNVFSIGSFEEFILDSNSEVYEYFMTNWPRFIRNICNYSLDFYREDEVIKLLIFVSHYGNFKSFNNILSNIDEPKIFKIVGNKLYSKLLCAIIKDKEEPIKYLKLLQKRAKKEEMSELHEARLQNVQFYDESLKPKDLEKAGVKELKKEVFEPKYKQTKKARKLVEEEYEKSYRGRMNKKN